MPKAKVSQSSNQFSGQSSSASRTPVKINTGGTPKWYKGLMFFFILAGLLYLVINYLAGPSIPFMQDLQAWNYGIGFGLFIIGLLMTMGWR
ncbi:cell division protein CrgA [Corynebacterium pseudodiphtheriticum]|uniref:cell division protein CrgA n=1 Tax=Corynebacterium pseudodiphtheriticum TaxID=37637 RepID=UPI0020BFC590|nr:cell division protein CrgA [Corynebacterium pseudodiphtheriticum]MDK8478559.1 cell division protein CrgA [Corynebacterium pseudodiphtheriticum]MDK8487165.1 cell division protein CrgA [Corynebacterium pseudodiphtheriticum]MDK8494466.1 cell division protein CrgA [Corynebacterium pseudodiphtheriticum]MDK8500586.1 cell division protein CrgA [Corynebacterium pseudodiphtheriticum]MDK8583626.1 cell division protein CrgA [Corynebacterium pseudodiphtheriticum]